MKHRYSPIYRPPAFCTLPSGWNLVERPSFPCGFDRRTDLPISERRFGVVEFDRALTEDEIRSYQLEVL